MAQGLQCWDGSGTLIVDLTDYNMRYMGTVTSSIAAGTVTSWNVAFAGMLPTTFLVVPQNYTNGGYDHTNVYCQPGTNSFTATFLPVGYHDAITFKFDVYSWG